LAPARWPDPRLPIDPPASSPPSSAFAAGRADTRWDRPSPTVTSPPSSASRPALIGVATLSQALGEEIVLWSFAGVQAGLRSTTAYAHGVLDHAAEEEPGTSRSFAPRQGRGRPHRAVLNRELLHQPSRGCPFTYKQGTCRRTRKPVFDAVRRHACSLVPAGDGRPDRDPACQRRKRLREASAPAGFHARHRPGGVPWCCGACRFREAHEIVGHLVVWVAR